jgi:NADH dehydrogenase
MWVFEGINKIGEGWLSWSQGSKSGWMFSAGVTQAGVEAVEQAAGAADDLFGGGAADLFGETADLFGSVDTGAAVDAVSAASGATTSAFEGVWDLTKSIFDVNGVVATWFRTVFMDGIAVYIPFQFFQLMVVVVEMAVGFALIGGLFTWWAAVVSIVLCLVFTFSGMFAWNQVWFLFAGFLMLGGAGRAFGLDCWVVPFFKKWWNGTRLARRHYWYLDGPSK